MSKPNETRSLPGLPGIPISVWEQAPLCKCGGTGRMPVIGWPGRTVICTCGAGKHIAQSGLMQPGDMRWV